MRAGRYLYLNIIYEVDLCVQHASQAQQQSSPVPDPPEEFWRCSSASADERSEQIGSVCFRRLKETMKWLRVQRKLKKMGKIISRRTIPRSCRRRSGSLRARSCS